MRVAVDESFRPVSWLRNPHMQSMLPTLAARRRALAAAVRPVLAASREMLLDCGDGVRLQAFHTAAPRPTGSARRTAVLLHGWEGSADSLYVLSLAQQVYARGVDVVRLNMRDHGTTHHLNRELFHSCRIAEVVGAVRTLQQHFAGEPLALAGFSLGGNFMLRVAAQAQAADLRLAGVVAISPVLEPAATLEALERAPRPYRWYFVRRWSRSLRAKQSAWPGEYDFTRLLRLRDLRAMTAELVSRFTSFGGLEEYLRGYAITGSRLAHLNVPARIITALDDPIIPARDLEQLPALPALSVTLTRYGGHCGFLERLGEPTWAERRAAHELALVL